MNTEQAINLLNENIPDPKNRMVDAAHMNIAIAWKAIKENLLELKKERDAAVVDICGACESLCTATGHGWESSCYDCKWRHGTVDGREETK